MTYILQTETSSFATTSSFSAITSTLLGSVTSASYAATASLLLGSVTSASFTSTSSFSPNQCLKVLLSMPILAALTWTNMPVVESFWLTSSIDAKNVTKVDLTNYNFARLLINKQGTAGATNSKLMLKYRNANYTKSVAEYRDISNPVISIPINVQNAFLSSSWQPITASAKSDVFIALIGSGGDGALDPAFGIISAEFRP